MLPGPQCRASHARTTSFSWTLYVWPPLVPSRHVKWLQRRVSVSPSLTTRLLSGVVRSTFSTLSTATYLVITRPSSYRSTLDVSCWRVPVTTSGASSLSFGGAALATPTHTTRTSPSNTRRVERIAVPSNEPTVPFPTYLSSEKPRKVTITVRVIRWARTSRALRLRGRKNPCKPWLLVWWVVAH